MRIRAREIRKNRKREEEQLKVRIKSLQAAKANPAGKKTAKRATA
ncbi:MAG: hypothetical protein ABJA67_13070 [Chthonomonadales bacterium]